jgi:hypothetical protein
MDAGDLRAGAEPSGGGVMEKAVPDVTRLLT